MDDGQHAYLRLKYYQNELSACTSPTYYYRKSAVWVDEWREAGIRENINKRVGIESV